MPNYSLNLKMSNALLIRKSVWNLQFIIDLKKRRADTEQTWGEVKWKHFKYFRRGQIYFCGMGWQHGSSIWERSGLEEPERGEWPPSGTFWFHLNVIVLRENVGGAIRVFLNGLWAQWWRDSTVWHNIHNMQMVTEQRIKQAKWSCGARKQMH